MHKFQSTPSVKRVTCNPFYEAQIFWGFQSTPSVKRVTIVSCMLRFLKKISIHTLCEEGDTKHLITKRYKIYFNPHPLWRGWHKQEKKPDTLKEFQSTPSVKRVTICILSVRQQLIFQSTPSVKRVTLNVLLLSTIPAGFQSTPSVKRVTEIYNRQIQNNPISIHTLCEEGDQH